LSLFLIINHISLRRTWVFN